MSLRNRKFADSVVLSYNDSVLYKSDLMLLDGRHWLNDSLIGFYLEYLNEEVYPKPVFCFIRPEITQCLKLLDLNELAVFLDPLEFKSKEVSFLPLNDCSNPESSGGSHWSLLVYSKPDNSFFHIDSSEGSNVICARHLASKLECYILGESQHSAEDNSLILDFKSIPSVQQSNSYDCGAFVLINIDNIAKYFLKNRTIFGIDLTKEVKRGQTQRAALKELILNLAGNSG